MKRNFRPGPFLLVTALTGAAASLVAPLLAFLVLGYYFLLAWPPILALLGVGIGWMQHKRALAPQRRAVWAGLSVVALLGGSLLGGLVAQVVADEGTLVAFVPVVASLALVLTHAVLLHLGKPPA